MHSCAILCPIKPFGVTAIPPRTTAKKSTAAKAPAKKPAVAKALSKKPAAKKAPVKAKAVAKKAANTTPAKAIKKASLVKERAKVDKAVAKKAAAPAKKLSPAQLATEVLCKKIAGILDTHKAEEISTLNLRDKCSFADFMIVASGRAPRHVSALADYVGDMLKKQGTPPLSIEGKESGDWVLIDAGDIVVHIFRPEVRQFYNIEKMWAMPMVNY